MCSVESFNVELRTQSDKDVYYLHFYFRFMQKIIIEEMEDVEEGVKKEESCYRIRVCRRSRNGGTDGEGTTNNNKRAEQERESV